MFIIGLYHQVLIPCLIKFKYALIDQINHIKGFRTLGVGNGFRTGRRPLGCAVVPYYSIDWTFQQGLQTEMSLICQLLGKTFCRKVRTVCRPRPGRGANLSWTVRTRNRKAINRTGRASAKLRSLAESRQGSERSDIQAFYQPWRKI